MIIDKKFVVYTTATNAESKGYLTTLLPSIQACTKNDFVDMFYVLDGQSSDNTREKLDELSKDNKKLEILESPVWNSSKWTWDILLEQYNFFLNRMSNIANQTGDEILVLYQGSDQVWTDKYSLELKSVCEKLVKEDGDYFLTPFRKTVSASYLTPIYPYHSTGFTVYSVMRIRPGITYKISGNEDKLLCSKNTKRVFHSFTNSSISYDMTFFTIDQIQSKICNHECGITRKEVNDYIVNSFLRKCLSMEYKKSSIEEHPVEMWNLIQGLDESRFGHSCFGHLRSV